MTRGTTGFLKVMHVLMIMSGLMVAARDASGQAVGAGPLTETLATTEPTSGVFNWSAVKFAPGLVISELGYDSNVFDQAVDPKEDWLFRGAPDISVFSQLRYFKISAYAGSQLAYFKTYEDENSVGYDFRGRIDFLLSRMLPFIGAGESRSRTRPNGEIDTRADHRTQELSGGLGFALGPHSQVYAAAGRNRSAYFNAVEEGVDLSESLNHDNLNYSVGVQTAITPLANLTVSGSFQQDEFEASPIRNAETRSAGLGMLIGAEAVISGTLRVDWVDFRPADPTIEPFEGLSVEAGITYPFLEIGRLNFAINRGIEYSFDEAEAYYEETSLNLAYTHRLFGDVDFQVRGSRSWFDYGFKDGVEPRTDKLSALAASFGYNLRNRTRVSVNYELAQRRSPAFADRNYDRTRIYLSWTYAF